MTKERGSGRKMEEGGKEKGQEETLSECLPEGRTRSLTQLLL